MGRNLRYMTQIKSIAINNEIDVMLIEESRMTEAFKLKMKEMVVPLTEIGKSEWLSH